MIRMSRENLNLNDENLLINTIYIIKNQLSKFFLQFGILVYNIVNYN